MLEVGRFSLFNNGGFVACIKFVYMGNDGLEHEVRATDSYPVLQTREASPGDCGVPDGSMVWLKVGVTAGYDNKSQRCFTYRSGNQHVADFTISGTTLDNSLEFKGLRTPAPQEVKPMGVDFADQFSRKGGGAFTNQHMPVSQELQPMMFSIIAKAGKTLLKHYAAGKTIEFIEEKVKPHGSTSDPAMATQDNHASWPKGESSKGVGRSPNGGNGATRMQNAFDGNATIPEAEFTELVPQGLVGEITGNLITSLAPIVGELTRVLLPLSADQDQAQLSAQGLLDQLVNTIMPAVIPSIGKMAVLLTQSILEEQVQGVVPSAQASAQPYVLPEAWRNADALNS